MVDTMLDASQANITQETVKQYYGQILQSREDLKAGACCTDERLPEHLAAILRQIHPQVRERFYGCGSPLPPALAGCTVLDLGCGSGRDCYLLSKLVGATGRVIGIDMTDEQLAVALRHQVYHAQVFGYAASNVDFRKGYIEDLAGLSIPDASVDVVVSNCVINLSPDKPTVFQEIFRVLKPGGELYFSDVFAGRRIPPALRHDSVLLGECLAGAMYKEDFRRLLAAVGCKDPRVMGSRRLAIHDPEIARKLGMIDFHSVTVRAFKLPLEDRCEDYGQVATYLGTVSEHPHGFDLDDHHHFETGRPMLVCGNTADMLARTRFAPHFQVTRDKSVHYGLFDCTPAPRPGADKPTGACC